MLIIPAIDLKDHQVVRLEQGDMQSSTSYSDDPLIIAKKWIAEGAQRLHIVDLNGAFEGQPFHLDEIRSIVNHHSDIEIQVGGGIRSIETLDAYFSAGVSYCILGTAAIKNPEFFRIAVKAFPGKIIMGLDAKEGKVAMEGWDQETFISAKDMIHRFHDCNLNSIVYTDIAKDGMLSGMSFDQTAEIAKGPFDVIASGGLTSLEDIDRLKTIEGVTGVIAGKALYENRFDLKSAIQHAQ